MFDGDTEQAFGFYKTVFGVDFYGSGFSDDHRTLRGLALQEDGQWNEFMVAHYRRQR